MKLIRAIVLACIAGFVAVRPVQGQTVPSFLNQWGTLGTGSGQFRYPYGITVAADGTVYVTDQYNYRIQEFSPTGEFIRSWGSAGTGPGQFGLEIGITTDSHGLVYVADYSNSRVQVFTANGGFVRQFANGTINPRYIAVAPSGKIFVVGGLINASDGAGSVYVYGPGGNLLNSFGRFDTPVSVALAPDGTLWVADSVNLTQFDLTFDTVLAVVPYFRIFPSFTSAAGMCILSSGVFCLCDYEAGRVVMFTPLGGIIGAFGTLGSQPGQLSSAADVDVGPDGSFYVADLLGCRVVRFGQAATPAKAVSWGAVKVGFR